MIKKTFKIALVFYLLSVISLLIMPTSGSGIKLNFSILGIRSDHWIHAILFIPFMILCKLNFKRENFLIYLFFAIAFASFCELLHYFIPYRSFDIQDFYANCTGVLIGSTAFLFQRKH